MSLPVSALQILGGYFSEMMSHNFSCAGSNDMPQEIFFALSEEEKRDLVEDFNVWDKEANPDGWEPRNLENIPDFLWCAYFMRRAEDAISEKNWETRFGADPKVSAGNSTPMAPPPQEEKRGTLGLGKPEKRRT